MSEIQNWTELIDAVSQRQDGVFPKLLLKIQQATRSYEKSDKNYNPLVVKKNHQDIFNGFKNLYEQLLIEDDIIDILTEVPLLSSDDSITFNLIGVAKWIKIHGGNASRLFFFDPDEKTMISDESISDFLNKIEIMKKEYRYFGLEPVVYYKFKIMPSDDILQFFKSFGVIPLLASEKTEKIDYPRDFGNKVLLDQPIVISLCSNLSYGRTDRFYKEVRCSFTKEEAIKNREEIEAYLDGKEIFVNRYVIEQTEIKINKMASLFERTKFYEWKKRFNIVDDANNPRFIYLKDIELNCVSVAERERAIIVTGNNKLGNKISTYYKEIPYKIFMGIQLSGIKYED